jgi:hypothetical protein
MLFTTSSNAAPLSVTVATVANSTTSAAPQMVAVPSSNVIDAGRSVAIAATADNGTLVSFAASSTVKLVSALNTVDAPKTIFSGVPSITVTSAGSAVTVYAYTTTTAVGSVTITNGSYSTIVYIAGIAGSAYNLGLTVPSATAVGTVPTIAITTTDVFGNSVSDTAIVTLIGSTFADSSVTKSLTTSTVTNSNGAVLGTVTAALSAAVAGEVTVVATGLSTVTQVVGLSAPIKSVIGKFSVSDLNATIAGLKAELATEKLAHEATKIANVKALSDAKASSDKALADAKASSDKVLADAKVAADKALTDAKASSDKALTDAKALSDATALSVKTFTDLAAAKAKAEYNALATKWNKANPKSKVTLKK